MNISCRLPVVLIIITINYCHQDASTASFTISSQGTTNSTNSIVIIATHQVLETGHLEIGLDVENCEVTDDGSVSTGGHLQVEISG